MVSVKQPGGLRARVLNAGLWTTVGHLLETLIRLGTSLILTRLLMPADFGLMAFVMTIPVSLSMLSDIGIHNNVIRQRGAVDVGFLQTAWTLQVLRGALLWGLVLILAGLLCLPQVRQVLPAASLLSHPQLPSLLAALGSNIVIGGFISTNIYIQERDIHFRPLVLRAIFSKILPVPVMIVLALLYHSVWSLVAGALLGQAILTLSSHILIPGAPMRFRWHGHHVKKLLSDGKWVTLSTIGTFFVSQGDRLILAFMLTATQMGHYAIAMTLAEVVRSLPQRLNGQITLPVLSELFRTRPESAIGAYYKYRRPIDIFAFTAAGFLWLAAPAIIHFLYDDRYVEAGWILQVLSLSLVSFPFQMINLAFVANDEWRNFSLNSLILSASFFAAVAAGYAFSGSTGVIWAIALYSWPATLVFLARAYRRGWVDPVRELVMLPFVLVGLSLGFVAQLVLNWIDTLL